MLALYRLAIAESARAPELASTLNTEGHDASWRAFAQFLRTAQTRGLLADDDALAGLEEAQVFGAEWLRSLGMIPNEYLYYFYFDTVAAMTEQPRGAYLLEQQRGESERAARDGARGRAVGVWTPAAVVQEAVLREVFEAPLRVEVGPGGRPRIRLEVRPE